MKRVYFILVFSMLIFLSSCKKDFSKISSSHWKPDVEVPFVRTEMTLRNLMGVDSLVNVGDDSLMVFYYQRDSIVNVSSDSLLSVGDSISSRYEFSVGDLLMSDFSLADSVTLNDLLPHIDPAVADTLQAHNGEMAIFPPFQLQEEVTVDLSPVSQYETLTFSEGYLDVEVTNQLPVSLNNLQLDVFDVINNEVIKSLTITNINPEEVVHDTLFLHGITLSNTFAFILNSMEADGSYPDSVLLNLEQGLGLQIVAKNLKIVSGMAKIENQIIYSANEWVDFDFDDAQLREVLFSEGSIKYDMESFLNFNVNVLLQLSSADVGGEVPEKSFSLSANSFNDGSWDLSNMDIDLTSDSVQPFNRMPVYFELVVEPTPTMVEFDSSDKVSSTFSLEDVKVAYASGNMGKRTFALDEDSLNIDLGFFENINGEIIFDRPEFSIYYQNGFGIPLVTHTNFYGVNQSTGNSVDLGVDSIVFNYPTEVGEVVYDSVKFDKTSSNIVDLLNVRPDKLIFSGDFVTNWNDDTLNFFTNSSNLILSSEIKIPLVFSTSSLVFKDTIDFLSGNVNLPVGSGSLLLNVNNGFPFDLAVQFQVLDSITGEIIDHADFGVIKSALVDDAGMVVSPTESSVSVHFTESFINNMKQANRLLLSAQTVSADGGDVPVGLYSDYKISFAISFEAKIEP